MSTLTRSCTSSSLTRCGLVVVGHDPDDDRSSSFVGKEASTTTTTSSTPSLLSTPGRAMMGSSSSCEWKKSDPNQEEDVLFPSSSWFFLAVAAVWMAMIIMAVPEQQQQQQYHPPQFLSLFPSHLYSIAMEMIEFQLHTFPVLVVLLSAFSPTTTSSITSTPQHSSEGDAAVGVSEITRDDEDMMMPLSSPPKLIQVVNHSSQDWDHFADFAEEHSGDAGAPIFFLRSSSMGTNSLSSLMETEEDE